MPIITPVYPEQNSTYNVLKSNRAIVEQAIKSGLTTINEIIGGEATWDKFFEPANFFCEYRHFVVLSASSLKVEDQLDWHGFIESKIRLLIGTLEKQPQIALVHAYPKSFAPTKPGQNNCTAWIIGLRFVQMKNLTIDLTEAIRSFNETGKYYNNNNN